MLTEYVLLLILSFVMVMVVLTGGDPSQPNGIKGIFTEGMPQLAIRMEKHLMTGYPFCVQYPKDNSITAPSTAPPRPGCRWE